MADLEALIAEAEKIIGASQSDFPARQHPEPDAERAGQFARGCAVCDASLLALAPGKTGLRGLWKEWKWFCSQDCYDEGTRRT